MLNIYTDASPKQDNAINCTCLDEHVCFCNFMHISSSLKCTYQADNLSGMSLGNQ